MTREMEQKNSKKPSQSDRSGQSNVQESEGYRLTAGWKAFVVMVVVLSCFCIAILGYELFMRTWDWFVGEELTETEETYGESTGETLLTEETVQEAGLDVEPVAVQEIPSAESYLQEAQYLAEIYDYDGAVACLQLSGYSHTDEQIQKAIEDYQAERDACVVWEPGQVTCISFQTLIVDSSKAFDGDGMQSDYNRERCTVDEFSSIIQVLYDEGYVMVSLHDLCTVNEDGAVEPATVRLPDGRIPFVLVQDDVSYHHYMEDDGFAQKLVIDEDGKVKNTYIEEDGTVSVGDYDVVPLIDTFVEEHPDFAYLGHKGVVGLTGYEGVLGYRTDEVYGTREESRLTTYQRLFFEENPDFDEDAWLNEIYQATQVANAMKAEGWEFASNTWGDIIPLKNGYDTFVEDTARWISNVESITGYTDIILFAEDADIVSDETPYAEDNEFYQYLKDVGLDIICCVNPSRIFVQFEGESMRMGRRSVDGYQMYYYPDRFTDLFTVSDVWDAERPTPVPQK